MLPPQTMLRIVRPEEARNEYECMVCQILSVEGPLSTAELVRHVADRMYYAELCHGTWVVDIGVFGPAIFKPEARKLLESMVGRCIEAENGAIS